MASLYTRWIIDSIDMNTNNIPKTRNSIKQMWSNNDINIIRAYVCNDLENNNTTNEFINKFKKKYNTDNIYDLLGKCTYEDFYNLYH